MQFKIAHMLLLVLFCAIGVAVYASQFDDRWFENVSPVPSPVIEALKTSELDIADCDFTRPISREDAYRILLQTNVFAGVHVYDDGRTSNQVIAYRVLLNAPNPKGAFTSLLDNANTAGQLYALCGLYNLDSSAYPNVRHVHRFTDNAVETQFGCLGGELPLAELLPDIDNGDFPGGFVN